MKRLAIANRGEIAIRIARTAYEMGLTSIGLHSKDDSQSLHTKRVDEVAALPGVGARAYLDIEAIIEAVKQSGCDAIHPGYGFLSESPEFAEAARQNGLVFVGPNVETLRLFGDKSAAIALANKLEIPTLGDGTPATIEAVRTFQKSLGGKPLILKAISGGGGRGTRIVRNEAELEEAFKRASSEAQSTFGSSTLYTEPVLENAKHIEVQILGDGSGTVSHLWDRDCTLQRRHQKLIEIAPAPHLSNGLRKQLIEAALKLAEATNYTGVGTVEFLVAGDDFYFIECNPRLQVEHTVTEEILDIDLVQAQLMIAQGASLADLKLTQKDIAKPNGYAVQARICLETLNSDGTSKPSEGTLNVFSPPSGPGIRIDTGVSAGDTYTTLYDSMVAKFIARAPQFDMALNRLKRSVDECELLGVPNNLNLLSVLLSNPDVHSGEIHTRYIDEMATQLVEDVLGIEKKANVTDPLSILSSHPVTNTSAQASSTHADEIEIPNGMEAERTIMSGILISYAVSPGDPVWPGKTFAVIESMKMEHELKASVSGIVDSLLITAGNTITDRQALLLIQPAEVERGSETDTADIDLDYIRSDLKDTLARIEASHDKNRPAAVKKRHGRGNRTARENIADLCDEDSFVEYGSVVLAAQRRRRSLDDLITNTTGDGMVCGLGHVNGHLFDENHSRIMAMSYDYMVLAGTQGALNHYKKDRMFEIAERQRLPVVLFAEGGGGRPGDTDVTGVAGLDCLAFTYFAKLSGLVPTIGIANGRCFAGNAVLLGCCDVVIATKNSNIGVGGPAMIEGGGLGAFRPEDIGPSEVQSENGVIDILVEDEAEATNAAKQYLSYFQGSLSEWEAPDKRALRFIVPEARKRWYDMRKVIEGIADIGSMMELRKHWAPGIITSFCRIEGRPVGILANNPSHLSGAIDAPGADKGTRFLQLCDAYDIPVVSLIDCPGIMVGPEIEKTALVRHASRMMVTGSNITTPMMSIVIRKGYGLGAQAMAGGSFKTPLFCVTWPTGEFGGMGLEGAVKLGFRKELEAIEDPEERLKVYNEMVERMYERGKAVNMASHFEVDDVIDPADTRRWIMAGLKSVPPSPRRTGKKRPNIDTW